MMNADSNATPNSTPHSATPFEVLSFAQSIIQHESNALQSFAEEMPIEFFEAIKLLQNCSGAVIVSGIGKAGWIGQKISASLASTGTRSHFLHPTEAFHGDFGRIGPDDSMLILSNSGETDEVLRLLPIIAKIDVPKVAITANGTSSLAKNCDISIPYGRVEEACDLGLAPTTSTTLMLAIGDSLAIVLSRLKGFTSMDFAQFHPGGSLGRKLQKVEEAMRPVSICRTVVEGTITRQALSDQNVGARRTGAILVIRADQTLSGIFTDSDLVKLLERKQDHFLDLPLDDVMTSNPKTIRSGKYVADATAVLSEFSISELPVVDADGKPLGIIDITDII